MESNKLFGGTLPLLNRALDLRSTRHNLIASNIANMDTPHFKSFDLLVEQELAKTADANNRSEIAIRQTQPGHLPGTGETVYGSPNLVADKKQSFASVVGNTVDLDQSMSRLTENSLKYNAAAQILSKKFLGLKNVIQGGGQ